MQHKFPQLEDTIELSGNTDIYFDKCRRLLECSDMLVQLQTNGHTATVWTRIVGL